MGYIDCDSHLVEIDERVWDFFDPKEKEFRPTINGNVLIVRDLMRYFPEPSTVKGLQVYPPGSVDLTDPAARLRYMDELGIDVHMMFPTFWLMSVISSPMHEAAMSRSYNRWVADRTSESQGRLRWAVHAPIRTMDRALEELEFGKANGAAGVFLWAQPHDLSVADPYLFPLYEKAQDLDLAITIHTSGDRRISLRQPGALLHSSIMTVGGAMYALLEEELPDRFPQLRWAFLEAGAAWVPYVLQEKYRGDKGYRLFQDWREAAREKFLDYKIFVACQMDDDLPYLLNFMTERQLIHGTDFGHVDFGSDPNGLHIVAHRDDLDPKVAKRIVDDNGRELYGIDPAFTPAPPASHEGPVLTGSMRVGPDNQMSA